MHPLWTPGCKLSVESASKTRAEPNSRRLRDREVILGSKKGRLRLQLYTLQKETKSEEEEGRLQKRHLQGKKKCNPEII